MIYRIASDGTSLTVEDGETSDSFTIPTANADEARALIDKALAEGVEAIRPAKNGK